MYQRTQNLYFCLFICDILLNVSVITSNYTEQNNCKINEFRGRGRKQSYPNLSYYFRIFLDDPRKTMKYLIQDIQSVGRDQNRRSLEYKTRVLTTRLRRSERCFRSLMKTVRVPMETDHGPLLHCDLTPCGRGFPFL